jgi:hypothetical protein
MWRRIAQASQWLPESGASLARVRAARAAAVVFPVPAKPCSANGVPLPIASSIAATAASLLSSSASCAAAL